MERWDGVVDEVRQAMIALTTTHDLLQIAHDKLKERVDGNALKPRELRPRQGRVSPSVPHMSAASGAQPLTGSQSQDFTAIDAELAKLNESMFKAIAER